MTNISDGALTGTAGLNALFDAFKQQDRTEDLLITATAGDTPDLKHEVLMIRIGDAKFLTSEKQALGLARAIMLQAPRMAAVQDAMILGEFAGALVTAVDAIRAAKRQTKVH
jgi:hypothetical protein